MLWSGQPAGRPTSAQVSEWYQAHPERVLVGDVLWVLACIVIACAYVRAGRTVRRAGRRPFVAAGVGAATALAASAAVAATLALGASDDAASWWTREGQAYRIGLLLAAASMIVLACAVGRSRRWSAAAATVVAVLLVLPATSMAGLVALVVLLAGEGRAPAGATTNRPTPSPFGMSDVEK
ncbi:hypothetical protein GCM10022242_33090 [Nocardioides panacisoli]|uniref:Uncharacterized protein n=1 Tax=Nocardioides panacisoli TaxID=627624 RepID=A0ABP7IWZ6_9ACTN